MDRVEQNPQFRQVQKDKAQQFAKQNSLKFEETSALTNARVTDVFENLLHGKSEYLTRTDIYEVKQSAENNEDLAEGKKYKKLNELNINESKKKGCC